jgi:hypothetical protein
LGIACPIFFSHLPCSRTSHCPVRKEEEEKEKLSQKYQLISSDQDKLQQICSDIERKLALFEPETQEDFLLKKKLENNYEALLHKITIPSSTNTKQSIDLALTFLQKLS